MAKAKIGLMKHYVQLMHQLHVFYGLMKLKRLLLVQETNKTMMIL